MLIRRHIFRNWCVAGAVWGLVLSCVPGRGSAAEADPTLRILFVGNSLTYANDLPQLVADLARSRKHHIEYDMFAPGGYRLAQHAVDPQLSAKIQERRWDVVVLQEQSQLPAFPLEQVQKQVYPFAQKLSRLIRNADPQTKIAFYMTMAARHGDRSNAAIDPNLSTYAGTQDRINATYGKLARKNQGWLIPVGMVWKKVRTRSPELGLYADDTHPNLAGTYLAACVFYAVLFHDRAAGLPYPQGIDEATAVLIQTITDETLAQQVVGR